MSVHPSQDNNPPNPVKHETPTPGHGVVNALETFHLGHVVAIFFEALLLSLGPFAGFLLSTSSNFGQQYLADPVVLAKLAQLEKQSLLLAFGCCLVTIVAIILRSPSTTNRAVDAARPPKKILNPIELVKSVFDKSYSHKLFSAFGYTLLSIRVLFLYIFIGYALQDLTNTGASAAKPSEQGLAKLHIVAATVYLLILLFVSFRQQQRLKQIRVAASSEDEAKTLRSIDNTFWSSAVLDYIFFTFAWLSTPSASRPYFLAYVIPAMATWLFRSRRACSLFIAIFIAILVHFFVRMAALEASPRVLTAPELDNIFLLLAHVLFWSSFGIVLASLRYIRIKAKKQVSDLSILRGAFEILETQQKHSVFVKDRDRGFLFANEIFLGQLTVVAGKKKTKWAQALEGPVRSSDIVTLTDKDLGIEDKDGVYEVSDNLILSDKKSGETDHYEAFEPAFDEDVFKGDMIWTHKEAIRDDNGRLVGIAGYIVPSGPVKMQEMSVHLASKITAYAIMKDVDGHILWANERYLNSIKDKLVSVLVKLGQPEEPLSSLSPAALLKHFNNGRGPTDLDIYDSDGAKYCEMDSLIVSNARHFLTANKTLDGFEAQIPKILQYWRDNGEGLLFDDSDTYPNCGWMEYHRFPGIETGCWVQVRKQPWTDFRPRDKTHTPAIKGIFVFFEDDNKGYLRKSISWRWLEYHLPNATSTNERVLRAALTASPNVQRTSYLLEFPLPKLINRMLLWVRHFVEMRADQFNPESPERNAADLGFLAELVTECYTNKVKLSVFTSESFVFKRFADDYFSILAALFFNAIEATLNSTEPHSTVGSVAVNLVRSGDNLVCTVLNPCAKSSDSSYFGNFQRNVCSRDKRPGGGLFFARKLTSHLPSRLKMDPESASLTFSRSSPSPHCIEARLTVPAYILDA